MGLQSKIVDLAKALILAIEPSLKIIAAISFCFWSYKTIDIFANEKSAEYAIEALGISGDCLKIVFRDFIERSSEILYLLFAFFAHTIEWLVRAVSVLRYGFTIEYPISIVVFVLSIVLLSKMQKSKAT